MGQSCAPSSALLVRLCLAILLCLFFPPARVEAQQYPTEAQVKAAYLYNFGKFVRREKESPSRNDSFDICVLGKDPLGAVLDSTVEGETIDGKTVTASRLGSIQEMSHCSVLFVSSSEEGRLALILNAAQRFSVLTVSDLSHFAERGGMIGLVMQGDKIRFRVNRKAAEDAHLVLSSELLKVAAEVIGVPGK
jgi:uncharacterized protein DUF4154